MRPREIRINTVCLRTNETPMVTDMIAKGELSVDGGYTARSNRVGGRRPTHPQAPWAVDGTPWSVAATLRISARLEITDDRRWNAAHTALPGM